MGSARDLLARDVEAALWSMQPFDPNVIPHATRLMLARAAKLCDLEIHDFSI